MKVMSTTATSSMILQNQKQTKDKTPNLPKQLATKQLSFPIRNNKQQTKKLKFRLKLRKTKKLSLKRKSCLILSFKLLFSSTATQIKKLRKMEYQHHPQEWPHPLSAKQLASETSAIMQQITTTQFSTPLN